MDLRHHVGDRFGGQLRRRGQAVLQILMPLAQDLEVDGDDGRRAFRGLRPVEQPAHEIVVLQGIDLEPEGLGRVFGDILDRTDRHGRQGEGDTERLGRAGGLDLAVGALHPGQPDRCQRHGHGHILTDHLTAGRPPGHVDRHPLAQVNVLKVRRVLAEGLLGPTARFRIVVKHLRRAPLVDAFQVVDTGDHRHDIKPNPKAFIGNQNPGADPAPQRTVPAAREYPSLSKLQSGRTGFFPGHDLPGAGFGLHRRRDRTVRRLSPWRPIRTARSDIETPEPQSHQFGEVYNCLHSRIWCIFLLMFRNTIDMNLYEPTRISAVNSLGTDA